MGLLQEARRPVSQILKGAGEILTTLNKIRLAAYYGCQPHEVEAVLKAEEICTGSLRTVDGDIMTTLARLAAEGYPQSV